MATSISQDYAILPEPGFVSGRTPAIQELNATVEELARTDIAVLFQGESGTGKEVYARLLHRLSDRSDRPLMKLGCTVVRSDELAALAQRPDDGGMLLLDNVDELDRDCQRALLSMLQARENTRGRKDYRLIATATKDLDREATAGRFRRELYYRIAGATLRLPALRERREDIPEFLNVFLERSATKMGRKMPTIGEAELELVQGYDWPGNIRELENLAKRIAALGTLGPTLAELRTSRAPAGGPLQQERTSLKVAAREASRLAERELILKALERTHWNRKQAAKQLQISYKALLYKIKQIEIPGAELVTEGEEE
jgi:two-component system response regulator AtoC